MKVTGTFQIRTTNVYPCPPLPVLHTPARKVKSEPKHREWRVNPMARGNTQHQHQNRTSSSSTSSSPGTSPSRSSNKTIQHQHQDRTSNASASSPATSPPRSSNTFVSSGTPTSSPNHHNTQRITLQRQKFDGIRKIQYINMNMRFANMTMALNTGYQKTQEQAEKRLRMEQTVKENSGQIMSC